MKKILYDDAVSHVLSIVQGATGYSFHTTDHDLVFFSDTPQSTKWASEPFGINGGVMGLLADSVSLMIAIDAHKDSDDDYVVAVDAGGYFTAQAVMSFTRDDQLITAQTRIMRFQGPYFFRYEN